MNKRYNIFVYGTLRMGGPANHLLVGARLVTKNIWLSGYKMFNMGLYPTVVPVQENKAILGDVYEVDEHLLLDLDEFEGEEFIRREDPFSKCILYVAQQDLTSFPEVTNGDWLAYAKGNGIIFRSFY